MTYWHMQLHPKDDTYWNREKELLENYKIIGIEDTQNSQLNQFNNIMSIGDIVLVKRGRKPLALVKVIGNVDKSNLKDDITNWISFTREIEVLDFFDSETMKIDFLLPAVRLSKSVNKKSDLYQFIDSWYQRVLTDKYIQNSVADIVLNQYKIQKVYISNLKMFNKFTLNLLDKDGIALPLVVIAGKNGTGKTTILEYLSDYNLQEDDFIEIFETHEASNIEEFFEYENDIVIDTFKLYKSMDGILEKRAEYKNNVIYIPVGVNDLGDLEEKIADYYITKAEELDSFKEALQNVQQYLKDIFDGLDLSFNISKIDYKEKKVFLSNHLDQEFQIEDMSTGEKTLMSKVLYLYFQDIKNKIILIDEPELSLHPAWQNRVLKLYENFAKENNCQIIIATHSPHIIGSAKNEWIRVLYFDENNMVKVLDKDLYAHGRDINSILFDVMGEVKYRPLNEFEEKIDKLYHYIDEQSFEKAKNLLEELEEHYGQNDSIVIEAKIAIDMLKYQS